MNSATTLRSPVKSIPHLPASISILKAFALLVGIICIAGASYWRRLAQERDPIVIPSGIEYFTFGNNEVIADLIWLRVIQDFEVCGARYDIAMAKPLSLMSIERCRLGWSYQGLDLLTDLAPQFWAPVFYGAMILSVLIQDREGARRIYDKGVLRFPNSSHMALGAAYHYLIEMEQPEKAGPLLLEAGRRGAPAWVYRLAARIYDKAGQRAFAIATLKAEIAAAPNSEFIEGLKNRLAELEKSP